MPVIGSRVRTIAKPAGSQVRGDVTLTEGANVTITQTGQDFTIASVGGGGSAFNMPTASVNRVAYWANISSLSYASGLAYDSGNTRFGVGVGSPVATLDIAGVDGSPSGVAAGIRLTNLEPGGATWNFRAGANGTNTPTAGLSFAKGNTYYQSFDTNGQVGINTTSPNERLTLEGRLSMSYTTGASNASGYGKFYVNPTDNLAHYISPAGADYAWNTTAGSVGGSGFANKLTFWTNASMISGATGITIDPVNHRVSIGLTTAVPLNALEIGGSFRVSDQAWTKSYRFRTSGSALDFDIGGADMYLSTFPNADFSGTQRFKLVMEAGADITQAIGQWQWRTTPSGTVHHVVDANAGVTFNENGEDRDVRLEGDTDINLFFSDASTDRVGIGTPTPAEKLSVTGRLALGFSTYASQSSGYGIVHMDSTNKNLLYTSDVGRIFKLNNSLLGTATSTATWAVDLRTGLNHKTMLSTATVTVWLQNPTDGEQYTFITRQDATGGRFILWPSTVVWAGGTTPTPTSGATAIDVFKLMYDGTDVLYRAVPTLNFAK